MIGGFEYNFLPIFQAFPIFFLKNLARFGILKKYTWAMIGGFGYNALPIFQTFPILLLKISIPTFEHSI